MKQGEYICILEGPATSDIGGETRVFYPENLGRRNFRNVRVYRSDRLGDFAFKNEASMGLVFRFKCAQCTVFRLICDLYARIYRGADKSLARPTFRSILSDGENILFDASLVIYIYINSTNIPPIMIVNRIYETENLQSL